MNMLFRCVVTLGTSLALVQCTPYAGHKGSVAPSLTYSRAVTRLEADKSKTGGLQKMAAGADVVAAVGTYLIGYLFEKADEAITKARTGDYGASAIIPHSAGFPHGGGPKASDGYFVLLRTVKYSDKLHKVATLGDFIHNTPGTAGAELYRQMQNPPNPARPKDPVDPSLAAANIRQVVKGMVTQKQIDEHEHIALLAVCPTVRLENTSPHRTGAPAVYAVMLDGLYYPVLGGKRFVGESSNLFARVAKAQESMVMEVYGPNGSGFTSGVVKVPLVWNPPGKDERAAQWVSGKALAAALAAQKRKPGMEQHAELMERDLETRLSRRQAFVAPNSSAAHLLRADVKVSETSEATGWLLKAMDKLEGQAMKLVGQ